MITINRGRNDGVAVGWGGLFVTDPGDPNRMNLVPFCVTAVTNDTCEAWVDIPYASARSGAQEVYLFAP
jgi:hypothetical protein